MGKTNVKKYKTVQGLQQKVDSYFDLCASNTKIKYIKGEEVEVDNPIPPTVEGLCSHLRITRKTLWNYENAEGYEDYHEIVAIAKQRINAELLKMGLMFEAHSGLVQFIFKSTVQGYEDKSSLDVTSKGEKVGIAPIEWVNGANEENTDK